MSISQQNRRALISLGLAAVLLIGIVAKTATGNVPMTAPDASACRESISVDDGAGHVVKLSDVTDSKAHARMLKRIAHSLGRG